MYLQQLGTRAKMTIDLPLPLNHSFAHRALIKKWTNSTLIRLRICVFTQLKCMKKQLKFIGSRNKKQLKSSIRKGKNTGAYRLISLLGGEKSTRRLVPGSIKIRKTAENQSSPNEDERRQILPIKRTKSQAF